MNTETLKVEDGTEMQAFVARPQGVAEKGIIVLQEAFGVNDYIMRMATRFAERGFLAIAPELFHRTAPPGWEGSYSDYAAVGPHMQALTPEGQSADLKSAFDWLTSQGIAKNKIAVLGFCMGGRAAFLANAVLPVAASVSFYGGSIAQQLLHRVKDLYAPQLLIWGGKDPSIPLDQTRAVADALIKAGKPFIEATFGDAGHAFTRDADQERYHEKSAREAWALVDTFLDNNLK